MHGVPLCRKLQAQTKFATFKNRWQLAGLTLLSACLLLTVTRQSFQGLKTRVPLRATHESACAAWTVLTSEIGNGVNCKEIVHAARNGLIVLPRALGVQHFEESMPEDLAVQLIRPFVTSSDYPLYIDVGTNEGQLAIQLLKEFKTLRSVLFEPSPVTCLGLMKSLHDNKVLSRSTLACTAVGAEFSERNLVFADASASVSTSSAKPSSASSEQEVLLGMPLDAIAPHLSRIAAFKTDTQGLECDVIRGAAELMTKTRPSVVVVEASYTLLRNNGCSVPELVELLHSFAYQCTVLAFHGRIPNAAKDEGFSYARLRSPFLTESSVAPDTLDDALKSVSPYKRKAGWTDLLCVPLHVKEK